jgi:hypothetical protein
MVSGKSMQIKDSNTAENSLVVQNTCNKSPVQKWVAMKA